MSRNELKEDMHADSYEDFVDWYQKSVAMPRGSIRPRFYLNLFSKPAEDIKSEMVVSHNLFDDELGTSSPANSQNLFEDEPGTPSPANSQNLFEDEPVTPLALLVEKVTQPLSPVVKQSPMLIDLSPSSQLPAYTYLFEQEECSPMEPIAIDLVTPPQSPKKWLNKHRQSIKVAHENARKKATQTFTSLNLIVNRELARSKKYYNLWVQERKLRDQAEARLSEFTANYFNKY